MLTVLLVLFVFFSTINLETMFRTTFFIGGLPILTWILYALYVFLIVYDVLHALKTKKVELPTVLWFFAFGISMVYSFAIGIPWKLALTNSVYYALPILAYPAVMSLNDKSAHIVEKSVNASIIAYGPVALAFMTGFLGQFSINDISNLDRSSMIIDGGLGLLGVALAMDIILYHQEEKNVVKYLVLIAGILIVVSGMSRARIVTMFLIVVLSMLFSRPVNAKTKNNKWKVILILLAGVLLCIVLFPSFTNGLEESIFSRFSIIGTDNSSIYRRFERAKQMQYFAKNPVLGMGWGGMVDVLVKDTRGVFQQIHNHNMYTSILCNGGLLYAIPYAFWFIQLAIAEIKPFRTEPSARLNVILMLTVAIMSFGSAGFVKYSMTIAMMIVYLNIRKRKETAA